MSSESRSALDPTLDRIFTALREANLPAVADCTPQEARKMLLQLRAARPAPSLPAIGSRKDITLPLPGRALSARLYLPIEAPKGLLVYFHGGGWVIGDIESADAIVATLVDESGWAALNVEYRLAPEHPYPEPLNDAYAAIEWAATEYGLPLAVGGDSAGANLAASSALLAREADGPTIKAQLLFYPVVDHNFETMSYRENGALGYLITTRDMKWFWDHYAPGLSRLEPLASPLLSADFSGLPPAYVVVAGFDPLRDEGLAYAGKLADAGVVVKVETYDTMSHGFAGMIGAVDQAEQSVRAAARWLAISGTAIET